MTVHVQLGDVATWVGGVGTAGALSAAVWQLNMLRHDRESEQASLVSAWASSPAIGFPDSPEDERATATVKISFRNGSTQPVGRVHYELKMGSETHRASVGPLAPDGLILTPTVKLSKISVADANSRPELNLWFTDEAGHRWHRPDGGRLRPGKLPGDWRELRMKVIGAGEKQTSDSLSIKVEVVEDRAQPETD